MEAIVLALSPVVVFAATAFVKWLLPQVQGKWIVTAIVPILSAVVALLGTVVVPEGNFWVTAGLSLVATWVREVISQWQKPPVVP